MPRPDGGRPANPDLPHVRYIAPGGFAKLPHFLRKSHRKFEAIIVSRRHNLIAFNAALNADPQIGERPVVVFDSEAIFAVREEMYRQLKHRAPAPSQFDVREEVELARTASMIIAVNEIDAAPFRDAGYPDVTVIGHAVRPAAGSRPHVDRTDLLFVGPLYGDDTPNSDSVIWFLDRVLPGLRRALGEDVHLSHVGTVAAPAILARAGISVELRGPRVDLKPEFDRARIFVAPTRFASGIPLKICEAAAHGVPCVLTPLLARQLGWSHEVEALIAETPEDFAAACLRLWSDEPLWRRIRDTALMRIARDCDVGRFDQSVASLYDRIRQARSGYRIVEEVA